MLKRTDQGKLDLVFLKEFQNERQVSLEVELDAGEYVVLPRTSGCGIQRPINSDRGRKIKLLDKSGNLSQIAELTAKDIFTRLDKLSIENALQAGEINEFLQRGFGDKIDSREFRKLLKSLSHDS